MKKKWLIPIVAAAAIFLVLQLYQSNSNNNTETPEIAELSQQQQQQASIHEQLSNNLEEKQKLSILQKDMNNSDLLVLSEIEADLDKLISLTDAKQAKQQIAMLQEEHPHYVYVKWERDKAKIQLGNFPGSDSDEAKSYFKDAERFFIPGDRYSSKLYYGKDHHQYRVLARVGDEVKLTAVVKASIIPQVEDHQRKNLRLVPYPAEGTMKVESVKPNSTVDTTVITGEDNGNVSHYYEKEVVVKFNSTLTDDQIKKLKQETHCIRAEKIGETYILTSDKLSTEELIAYLKENWPVSFVEPHYIYLTNEETTATFIPNDSLFSRYQWNITNIHAETGWNISRGSEDVIIAVLDSGVQSNHPDLSARLLAGYNVNDGSTNAADELGHGTHVAGIIGASVDNQEGIAGVTWYNSVLPVKVLNSSGAGSTYSVAQGIIWATDQGAKVINMSLGNYASGDFLHEAIKYAYERDVVLVAATGNDNTNRPGYPAAYPEVFAVGATTSGKQRAAFSNYGDYVDVVAPGDSIASTYIGGQYAALSGTSMASPHVAALAGLIRSVNPSLTNTEVMDIMRQTATDLGDPGYDQYYGYGEIDVQKALNTAASYAGTLQTYPKTVKNKLDQLIND
ncbi:MULTISPECIES: S8 family peptidase [Paenibacillus]|uniref:S8 family peptidase n=1 Tax=Paenibacillus TaxID=44249 RepID=UPI00203EEC6F|nr:S8 family peptidase [Paenibacillus camelliae]MCM3633217.1 S8 family peptidase [Paenibacillus camelliae]